MDDPPKLGIQGAKSDAETAPLHPEVVDFVRWFTGWWLTRGLELVARQEEGEERHAA